MDKYGIFWTIYGSLGLVMWPTLTYTFIKMDRYWTEGLGRTYHLDSEDMVGFVCMSFFAAVIWPLVLVVIACVLAGWKAVL